MGDLEACADLQSLPPAYITNFQEVVCFYESEHESNHEHDSDLESENDSGKEDESKFEDESGSEDGDEAEAEDESEDEKMSEPENIPEPENESHIRVDGREYASDIRRDATVETRIHQLLQCYFLAESLQATNFQNAIIDALLEICLLISERALLDSSASKTVILFSKEGLQVIYANTPSGSPLRRLAVELIYWAGADHAKWMVRDVGMCKEEGLEEFYGEMLQRRLSKRGSKKPWYDTFCKFHKHEVSKGKGTVVSRF